MPLACIYCPTSNAMQSGQAQRKWRLEFVPDKPYFTDTLMGWTGMQDSLREIRLQFATAEEAVAYAKKHGISYELQEISPSAQVKKAYADNFSAKKVSV